MDAIGGRIAQDFPDSNKGWGVSIVRYMDSIVGPQLRSSLYVLLSAVGMLLLIGCANLANLTLARGTSREREVAVRASLGAGRGRLVRQFLTENIVAAAAGGIAGIGVGYAFMRLLTIMPASVLPARRRQRRDGHAPAGVRVRAVGHDRADLRPRTRAAGDEAGSGERDERRRPRQFRRHGAAAAPQRARRR